MGFFSSVTKAVKKGWKDTLGWVDDKETLAVGAPIVLGALTGGIGAGLAGASSGLISAAAIVGGIGGGMQGLGNLSAMKSQEQAQAAQLAAAQKIADAQNPANIVTAVTPTASTESAKISEENAATEAKRRYSFSNTLYKRNTLGRAGAGGLTAKTKLG